MIFVVWRVAQIWISVVIVRSKKSLSISNFNELDFNTTTAYYQVWRAHWWFVTIYIEIFELGFTLIKLYNFTFKHKHFGVYQSVHMIIACMYATILELRLMIVFAQPPYRILLKYCNNVKYTFLISSIFLIFK